MKDEQIQIWSRGTHKSSNRVRLLDTMTHYSLLYNNNKSLEKHLEK